MSMGPLRCVPGLSSMYSNPLTDRLEQHLATLDASYRESYLQLLLGMATLHDAVDAALGAEPGAARDHLAAGLAQLRASNERLTALGESLTRVRVELFESAEVDAAEPLLLREPFFARLDYDALYRELAGQGAALPHRAFWDEAATRMCDGGARGGFRLLDRHVRELQSDLRAYVADVESAGRLSGRALGERLHDTAIPTARVVTGYTRLLTTFGYVSFLCERAMLAYEAAAGEAAAPALAAG
jgi:hypothetical protein